eukprot:TRINITY_DN14186_c0_g1_i1.p1 TRINITY_DN14186_c0_g1~~TRINITY_DN14186_c0_g1_i1.p1  ORF type:complete len:353 (-),score=53.16 TRINITY_DN14186_c0_g1_i1:136-1194(-)
MREVRHVAPLAVSVFCAVVYCTMVLVHFERIMFASPTERISRDQSVVRLPRLFLCPADRYRQSSLKWNSFECKLSFKTETGQCRARLQRFGGQEPEEFGKHRGDNMSHECLEFGTHLIGVREEWSAAWNEITLKASFVQNPSGPMTDIFQEMEIGYMPREWEIGLATRVFLAEEIDKGRHSAGDYWYFYGATTVPTENATIPEQGFLHETRGEWVKVPGGRRGVVHVVVTLDDFEQFEYRLVSPVSSFLLCIGQISGVMALFAWAFFRSPFAGKGKGSRGSDHAPGQQQCQDEEDGQMQSAVSDPPGGRYRSVAATEEGEEEEQESLLKVEDRSSSTTRAPLLEASTEGEGL